MYKGVSSVALKTESDGVHVTECSDNDQPTTSMYIILMLCLLVSLSGPAHATRYATVYVRLLFLAQSADLSLIHI